MQRPPEDLCKPVQRPCGVWGLVKLAAEAGKEAGREGEGGGQETDTDAPSGGMFPPAWGTLWTHLSCILPGDSRRV